MNLVLNNRINDYQLRSSPGHDIRTYPPRQPPCPPCSPRRWWLSPEQGGGDIVAAVFFQLIGGGVHLKPALFFF